MSNVRGSFLLPPISATLPVMLALACASSNPGAALPEVEPDAGAPEMPKDKENSEKERGKPLIEWSAPLNPVQLLEPHTEEDVCASGWTATRRDSAKEDRDYMIPLQPRYVRKVDRYNGSVAELGRHAGNAYVLIGREVPVVRLAIMGPCLVTLDADGVPYVNRTVLADYREGIQEITRAGFKIELVLQHRASYPVEFHEHPDFGMAGGWSHPDWSGWFAEYVDTVLAEFDDLLDPGTVIYLGNETMAELFDGYLHPDRKFPPGASGAAKSLYTAALNVRDAFIGAGYTIEDAGYTPAIAPNIRPFVGDLSAPGTRLLEYVYNWWLTDALVHGCIDNDFDEECEEIVTPTVRRIGITFYGVMGAEKETVEFGPPGGDWTRPLARRWLTFEPNAGQFEAALISTFNRYEKRLGEPGFEIGVAEIGFSGTTTEQVIWLGDYYAVMLKLGVRFAGIHALLKHAEFSEGAWFFELAGRCEGPCELMDWGRAFVQTLEVMNYAESP